MDDAGVIFLPFQWMYYSKMMNINDQLLFHIHLWKLLTNYNNIFLSAVLTLANLTIKGCASKGFCDAHFQNSTLVDVHCCPGSFCNRTEAWNRQNVGLLLMMLSATKLLLWVSKPLLLAANCTILSSHISCFINICIYLISFNKILIGNK